MLSLDTASMAPSPPVLDSNPGTQAHVYSGLALHIWRSPGHRTRTQCPLGPARLPTGTVDTSFPLHPFLCLPQPLGPQFSPQPVPVPAAWRSQLGFAASWHLQAGLGNPLALAQPRGGGDLGCGCLSGPVSCCPGLPWE